MENDRQLHRIIASARQIMDVPEENEPPELDGPLYLNWFALGHGAVLLYLALRALRGMTPLEQALVWSAVAVVGFSLALVLRGKVRTALAMAMAVVPAERNPKAPR
jgi:Na+-translocating ferredoxin:NAD+ oxidoreductase RnfA subunit